MQRVHAALHGENASSHGLRARCRAESASPWRRQSFPGFAEELFCRVRGAVFTAYTDFGRPGGRCSPGAVPLPYTRAIVVRGVHWNLNLRELHDSLYGEPRGGLVWFFIARGALILSRSAERPALRTGPWPAMATAFIIENLGRIQGKAGVGGAGGQQSNGYVGQNGANGGDALLVEHATTILNSAGGIWGGAGGGGGGAGGAIDSGVDAGAGGGGGGAGSGSVASGGAGGNTTGGLGIDGSAGSAGSAEAGGNGGAGGSDVSEVAGVWAGAGGAGGGPGLNGNSGDQATFEPGPTMGGTPGSGGTAGRYVVGNSLVTWESTGDVRGGVA